MMLAPNGIVLGPGRVRFWWLRLLDYLERRYAPHVLISRSRSFYQEAESHRINAEITRLEGIVDKIWP